MVACSLYSLYTVMSYELLLSLYGECYVRPYGGRIFFNFAICTLHACPKLIHTSYCSFTFAVLFGWLAFNHYTQPWEAFGLAMVCMVTLCAGWYIHQDRELLRFQELQNLERREKMAIMRE